ncbi:MAG: hypothetical protein IH840_08810, partial [Candidatus Heimdallarchaeota archaeon]|nr:hypothetical protein [Candidatus Heimdallarchaeota archaeon]
MKETRLVYALIFYLIYLMISGAGEDGTKAVPDYSTRTETTLPSHALVGDVINAMSTTTWQSSPAFLGNVEQFLLNQPFTHGENLGLQVMRLTDPTFDFRLAQTLDIYVVQIPIISIQSQSSLSWNIQDDQSMILFSGNIHYTEFSEMVDLGSLLISIGSHQSFASGLSLQLSSSTPYSLSLGGNITIPTTDFYNPDLIIISGETEESVSTQLQFFEGSYLGTNNVDAGGQTTTSFQPDSGIKYLLSYYGDPSGILLNSFDFNQISISHTTAAWIGTSDLTATRGTTVYFVANLRDQETNLPLIGMTVNFYLNSFGSFHQLGMSTTDVNGVATLNHLINMQNGTYAWLAETTVNGFMNHSLSSLTVQNPSASFVSPAAQGNFGSAPNNETIVDLSVSLISNQGAALQGELVQLYHDQELLANLTSDDTGKITYQYLVNEAVGTYVDYYTLQVLSTFW